MVAVAIFATNDLDADDVNMNSVVWAGANVAQREDGSYFSAVEDVDGDGHLDLVLHFRLAETDLLDIYERLLWEDLQDGTLDSYWQSVDIALEGFTNEGDPFVGSDTLDLFLIGNPLRDFRNQRGIWTE